MQSRYLEIIFNINFYMKLVLQAKNTFLCNRINQYEDRRILV